MREIKFRAWDGERMRGIGKNEWFSIRSDGMLSFGQHGDPAIALMQFTGLKDKNGVEIYEGDICRVDWNDSRYQQCVGAVGWDPHNASWSVGFGLPSEAHWSHEVIGNIHENPELLEKP